MDRNGIRIALAGALGGAVIALAVIAALVQGGALESWLVAHPQILARMSDSFQEQTAEQQRVALTAALAKLGPNALVNPRLAYVTGPADAKHTLVEFFDYNCPYCRASTPALKTFMAAHKNDVRIALIEFPVKGDDSMLAAHVAVAARKQGDKYLALHFALMAHKDPIDADNLFDEARKAGLDIDRLKTDAAAPDVAATVESALSLARAVGIDGTPTFIIDGKAHMGMLSRDAMESALKN